MPSAQEVKSMLAGYNSKIVEYTPKELLRTGEPVHIYNVGPKRWGPISLGSLGQFTIFECLPGEQYSRPCKVPFMVEEHIPVDMKKMVPRLESGRAVALDIIGVGAFKSADQDLRKWGVFIAEKAVPSKQELADANEAFKQQMIRMVKEGDDLYALGPKGVESISKDHRDAVTYLKQDRDWAKMPKQMVTCPGCGESVNPEAAVHAGKDGCGAVIDEEKVKRIRLKGYEHIWKEAKA